MFYCDLISGDDFNHYPEFYGEELIDTKHERGTIQAYYNYAKIVDLIDGNFEIVEANLIRNNNIVTGSFHSRYHLILKRK